MPIKIPFYGKWSMAVIGKTASFLQRVQIEDSLASDGFIPGEIGQTAEIDGERWMVIVASSGNNGATWQASNIKRVPGVIYPNGLIVTIYSDDIVPGGSDGDYDDLILQFTYRDPEVNPSAAERYPFTLPEDAFRPRLPPRRPRCACSCHKQRCSC